jgi:hypothetical protein
MFSTNVPIPLCPNLMFDCGFWIGEERNHKLGDRVGVGILEVGID